MTVCLKMQKFLLMAGFPFVKNHQKYNYDKVQFCKFSPLPGKGIHFVIDFSDFQTSQKRLLLEFGSKNKCSVDRHVNKCPAEMDMFEGRLVSIANLSCLDNCSGLSS